MKRKQLEDLELTAEQIDAVMKINGDDIESLKSETKSLQTEIDGLKTQVGDRDKQLEELKKSAGDNEELKKQIATLQDENKTTKAAHEAELKKLKVDYAVDKALTESGAKNIKAARALLSLDEAELLDDGSIKGLSDQIKALTESDDSKFLFGVSSISGFSAGQGRDVPPANGSEFETRLAQARKNGDFASQVAIKREAAEQGVYLL